MSLKYCAPAIKTGRLKPGLGRNSKCKREETGSIVPAGLTLIATHRQQGTDSGKKNDSTGPVKGVDAVTEP